MYSSMYRRLPIRKYPARGATDGRCEMNTLQTTLRGWLIWLVPLACSRS
jgi:hypothetical protein